MNGSVPISAEAIIPVSQSDVAGIPDIALAIPDFEGSAQLRIYSNTTQTEIGCFQAVMRNGATLSHPAAVGSTIGVFTFIALLASFATAIYGVSVPHMRTHYAHSLSVLVVFEVMQSIFFTSILSVNWPSVLPAFWSNFAWSAGLIYTPHITNSINGWMGDNLGNSTQVGGAGSTALNNNGGLQIYGRSPDKFYKHNSYGAHMRGLDMINRMQKRASTTENTGFGTTGLGYNWAGGPVEPGLPIPGNWTGFAGALSDVKLPVTDAFTDGLIWLLILLAILIGAFIAFKYSLEAMSKLKWIREDRLAFFRSHWLGFLGLVVLRTLFIAFFAMMTLTLFQLSYGGTTGVIALAAIIFIIFFAGLLGIAGYACYKRLQFGRYQLSSDRIHFQGQNKAKIIPWFTTVRESQVAEKEDLEKTTGLPFVNVCFKDDNAERQGVHEDQEYIKRWGWLSARYRKTRWWFFAVWLVYQFVRACFYGGAQANPKTQVIGALVVEIIALVGIIWMNPFEGQRNTALAVYMLSITKVASVGLSISFLPEINLARIPATVIGFIIVVIQGFLMIGVLILIVLSAISSYMSLTRNREEFRPRKWEGLRIKYFQHLERKASDRPPTPPPVPEEPRDPYFSVNSVRRAPKIEDEDDDFVGEIPSAVESQQSSGKHSRANSMRSSFSGYGNLPYGARPHRASWSSRDFTGVYLQDLNEDEQSDAPAQTPTPRRIRSATHSARNSIGSPPMRPRPASTHIPPATAARLSLASKRYSTPSPTPE